MNTTITIALGIFFLVLVFALCPLGKLAGFLWSHEKIGKKKRIFATASTIVILTILFTGILLELNSQDFSYTASLTELGITVLYYLKIFFIVSLVILSTWILGETMNMVYILLPSKKQVAIHNRYYYILVRVAKKIGLKKIACRFAGTEPETKTNK